MHSIQSGLNPGYYLPTQWFLKSAWDSIPQGTKECLDAKKEDKTWHHLFKQLITNAKLI